MLTILHLIRRSAFNSNQLENCLATLSAADSIVLIDDGCYSINHPSLIAVISTHHVYVVTEHVNARGVCLIDSINSISLKELTDLMFNHDSVVTWQ